MPSTRKHKLSAALAGIGLVTSAGLASVALAGSGGVGTGGGGGGGGGHEYVFPVPAKHSYGDGLGAGRGHQGQDIFAGCGSRLVANRTATVQIVDYQSAAGNYIVLDEPGSAIDYAYMHLKQKAIPREGSKVKKGEKIGEVGETGRASGCHLHFEKWTGPDIWAGEPARNVTRALRKWDKYS